MGKKLQEVLLVGEAYSYAPRESGALKDLDGFIEFLEDELSTYSKEKQTLQYKDRLEASDHVDEGQWKFMIKALEETLDQVKKLKRSYENRATTMKNRYK